MTSGRSSEASDGPDKQAYRGLLESFAQATWQADASGALLDGSAAWQKLTGQLPRDWSGSGWLNVVHAGDRAATEAAWREAVASGNFYTHEYRLYSQLGGWVWTLAHAVPQRAADGSIVGWLGMNVDITARKEAEQALQEADRQKDEFLAVLAHELRNPLAPLRSAIDLLLNGSATATAKARAIAVMSRQIFFMSRLVDDLVDASRITTGALQMRMANVFLADVLHATIESIEPAIKAKRQSLESDRFDSDDAVVHGDAVRLTQAFVNILNNSAKFSAEGTSIRIELRRRPHEVSVVIRDQGRRIPAADMPNIFRLFIQSSRHDRGDGLGIGLALAHDVVKLHGGSIEVRNASAPEGAEFEVTLPTVAPEAQASQPPGAAPHGGSLVSKRILVVDDNSEAGETLGALLEIAGHTVRLVHDGQEAVGEAAVFLPDVIFMDIGMPVMDGLEATRRIRALNLAVRPFVVALTGWTAEANREASRAAGCDLHLGKPAEFDALVAAIECSAATEPQTGMPS